MLKGSARSAKAGIFSNYCGLGGYGVPRHEVDRICMIHDNDYATIIASGKNPYTSYNWADEKMQAALARVVNPSWPEIVITDVSQFIWTWKKRVLSNDPSLLNLPDRAKTTKRKDVPTIDPRPSVRRNIMKDEDMEKGHVQAVKSGSVDKDAQGQAGHETPVIWHQPQFGLPETYTVVCPLTMYFSVANLDHGDASSTTLTIRATSPWDPIPTVPLSVADAGRPSNPGKGIYVNPLTYGGGALTLNKDSFGTFPRIWTGAEAPAWRDYFSPLYESYAVLGMHYRATVRAVCSDSGADIVVATATEAYSGSSTGQQIPANCKLDDTYAWKGFRYYQIANFDNDQAARKDVMVITGSYKPGDNDINVRNDQDVKTWTAVGQNPSLTENVKLFFWRSPLGIAQQTRFGVNVMLEVKYIVQFKDLVTNARWPQGNGSSSTVQTLPNNALQI